MITAHTIRWRLVPASWPSSRPMFDVAIEALPVAMGDVEAEAIELLALAITDLRDELAAVRAVLSSALALSHAQHIEIFRLRRRLVDLHDARRGERTAV